MATTIQDVDAAFAAVGSKLGTLDAADQNVTAKKAIADDLHTKATAADADENTALEAKVTALQAVMDAFTNAQTVLAAYKAGT